MAERVVLIHDMSDMTVFSELAIDEACELRDQLDRAIAGILDALRDRALRCPPPALGLG